MPLAPQNILFAKCLNPTFPTTFPSDPHSNHRRIFVRLPEGYIRHTAMRRLIPDVRRYSLAISSALAALLLRKILTPLFGHENPYLTTWAALVISAWYCGI